MKHIPHRLLARVLGGVQWGTAARQGLQSSNDAANWNPSIGPIPDAISMSTNRVPPPTQIPTAADPDWWSGAKRTAGFVWGTAKGIYQTWGKH